MNLVNTRHRETSVRDACGPAISELLSTSTHQFFLAWSIAARSDR